MSLTLTTLAAADAYYAERGVTAWAAQSDEKRTGGLLYAEDYLRTQATCPDFASWDSPENTPDEVEQAVWELAGWHVLVAPITTGIATPPGGLPLAARKLGPMERRFFERGSTISGQEFESWIAGLLNGFCTLDSRTGTASMVKRQVRV